LSAGRVSSFVLVVCLWAAAAAARAGDLDDIERAEQVGWRDPDTALAMLDTAQATVQSDAALVQWLTVRGMLLVDRRSDRDSDAVIMRLRTMGERGLPAAARAGHFLHAYQLSQTEDYDGARTELRDLPADSMESAPERFRFELLRGSVFQFVGQQELAIHSFETALDVAREMRSVPRELRALHRLVLFLVRVGNTERAAQLLATSRTLADQAGDEAALASISMQEANLADSLGDHERTWRAEREALEHARKSGSKQLLSVSLAYVADGYLKAGDYRAALQASTEGLELARSIRSNGLELTTLFNSGVARIGLGDVPEGKRLVESVITRTLAGGNISDADGMLGEYGQALERIGDWHGAVGVYHQSDSLREKLMTAARQRAMLEMTAKFDDERKTREIALLRSDNALQGATLRAQQLRQAMTLLVAALVVVLAAALGWAFHRVRKANLGLRHASEHDSLTALRNRRYFNDKVLSRHVDRRFTGGVLLIDIDHFKRINDVFGHPGGDAVLQAIARRLQESLRDGDTLVRWGGEEFLAVLPPMSRDELTATARRLLAAVHDKPVLWRSHVVPCTVSIGYSVFPVGPDGLDVSLERGIALVDKALYEAKKRGRNRACMITAINPGAAGDLTSINAAFDVATADNVVQLKELEAVRA
jgi:diguanylate cyclase (GGDEF)-like protein